MNRPLERPLGAQISHMLKARGVDVIFGIPGVHNQEMYRGIEEAGITHVLARHEQGAGFMADGYARASGQPGVAFVISGPGVCNIMTPMGQGYSDSVPMLVISSCLDEVAATRGQLHQMKDQRAAAETVCDWSEEARTAEAAYALIDRALMEFKTQRRRPKHIQVPIKLLESPAAPARPRHTTTDCAAWPEEPGGAPRIAAALAKADRPLFVFGGGAAHCTGYAAQLLEMTGALAFTTYAGRGVIAPDHPQLLGSTLGRPDTADIFASADLVIALGTELAEVDLWRNRAGHDCLTIRVDLDPEVLTQSLDGLSLPIHGNVEQVIAELCDVTDLRAAKGWSSFDVAAARARWRAEVNAERPGILTVADALRAALPEGTMIYSDMTQFAYAAKEVWDMDRPGHWHHPTGFGTLGYALPAAIGGAMARPGQPTLAIAGDYGLQYTIQELGTAVELGLTLPIFVWDNGKLGEIEDSMTRAQIAPNAVIQRNPNFVALAQAWGANASAPTSLDEMTRAVRAAFSAQGPTLIHVQSKIAG